MLSEQTDKKLEGMEVVALTSIAIALIVPFLVQWAEGALRKKAR